MIYESISETNFRKYNNLITNLIKEYSDDYYSYDNSSYKLPISDAVFCVDDIIRNKKFYDAIKLAVFDKKNMSDDLVFFDIWSWTWILWIFWLICWADRCYFIEENPYTLDLSKYIISTLWLTERSIFINSDALNYNPPEKYDIMISETLVSNFNWEDFPYIVNKYLDYWKDSSIIIPEGIEIDIIQYEKWEKRSKIKKDYDIKRWLTDNVIDILNWNIDELEFSMNISLYKDILLYSWECPLFINNYRQKVNNFSNSFFKLKIK